MATQLPIYQPYATVQNSYQQMMGSGPIQYNVPLSSLRQEQTAPTINTLGNLSDQEQVDTMAQRLANRARAQQQAQYTTFGDTLNQNLALLGKLDIGRDAAANLYAGAYNSGYLRNEGPGFYAQGSSAPVGSTLYNSRQRNQELNYANTQATLLRSGVDPKQVERAYQRLLKNNQF